MGPTPKPPPPTQRTPQSGGGSKTKNPKICPPKRKKTADVPNGGDQTKREGRGWVERRGEEVRMEGGWGWRKLRREERGGKVR